VDSEKRNDQLTRDSVLKLLSDDEVGRVSTMEGDARLMAGDEYVDLEHLNQGVRRAAGNSMSMGGVLPRKAVREDTWSQIVTLISVIVPMPSHPGP